MCLGLVLKGRRQCCLEKYSAEMYMRMEQVDEVSVGMSLSFHLLVFLISSMLNTLVHFLLKTGNKSASEKM